MKILLTTLILAFLSGCTAAHVKTDNAGSIDATYFSLLKDIKVEKTVDTVKVSGTQAPDAIYECAALIAGILIIF